MKTIALSHWGRWFICKHIFAISGLFILLLSATTLTAQNKWSVTLGSGINFPTNNLGGTNLNTGFGFEGALAYRFMPHLAVYSGWSWNKFSTDKQVKEDIEETGYNLGLQFMHPFSNSRIEYMLKAGATYKHIETENNAGVILYDTGHGWGWQVGGGLAIPITKKLLVIPELRYNALSRDYNSGDGIKNVDLNYLSVGAGLSLSF